MEEVGAAGWYQALGPKAGLELQPVKLEFVELLPGSSIKN